MLQVTYQKRNGNILQRFRKTMIPYQIGDTTSMGWKVLNIEYEYKNKYYSKLEYDILIHKNKQRFIIKKQLIDTCFRELKSLLYLLIMLLLINLI